MYEYDCCDTANDDGNCSDVEQARALPMDSSSGCDNSDCLLTKWHPKTVSCSPWAIVLSQRHWLRIVAFSSLDRRIAEVAVAIKCSTAATAVHFGVAEKLAVANAAWMPGKSLEALGAGSSLPASLGLAQRFDAATGGVRKILQW